MCKSINDYPFELLDESEIPDEPDRLFTESQLQTAVADVTDLSREDVDVNKRFTRRVAEVQRHRVSDEANEVRVSWDVFADENRYDPGVGGWVVLMSCLDDLGVL